MTRTITLTESTLPLWLDPVFRAGPLLFTATKIDGITTYRAQIWRKPQDARAEDAEALATAYAIAGVSTVTLAFSSTLMDFTLAAGNGAYDDVWLSIVGVQSDGQIVPLRADWMRVIESGNDPASFVVGDVVVTVENDIASFTYEGVVYSIPVYEATPSTPGTTGWLVSVVDGMLILAKDGESYAAPVIQQ